MSNKAGTGCPRIYYSKHCEWQLYGRSDYCMLKLWHELLLDRVGVWWSGSALVHANAGGALSVRDKAHTLRQN